MTIEAAKTIGLTIVDRRRFLAGAAALVAAGLLPRQVLALAAPHKFTHGAFEVTVASDGHLVLPVGVFAVNLKPDDLKTALAAAGIAEAEVKAECSPAIVKSGSDIILIDTGGALAPTNGKLVENLAAAGVDPGTITKVAFTHAHPDHIWGTLGAGDKLNFPNATYYVAEAEWNFWMDKDIFTKLPKDFQAFATGAQKNLGAIKDKLSMVKPGAEIVSGVAVVDSPGHTPGHVSYELAGDDGLIIVGDAVIAPGIYFAHPDWHLAFDAVPELAVASRKMLLDRAAAEKKLLLGYHWPYPGIGRAEKKDGAYVYVPAS